MGMTIEEAIEIISDIDKAYRTFSNMEYKAMQKAIDTMRKYQKIEELAEYHMIRFLPKERMSGFQKDILEVLEDGSTN